MVALQKIADILKHFKDDGQDLLESKLCSSGTKADERSHAILGYLLSLLDMHIAEALTTWQPLLSKSPSQMEYLAAISFCEQSRLAVLERPAFPTLDTRVLEGLLRSRRKQYDQAAKVLEATMVEVISQYGPCSLQVGIATAELANCYNVLRREALAELTLTKSLEMRLDSSLSNRRDGIYLRLALADSFIGQAKYQDAVPILQRIIDDPDVSATFRMMSALRLTRSRRRMHEDARKAFEQKSPLWIGLPLLDTVPDVLVMEYVEELGCSISELPKRELEGSKNTQELIEAVNSALGTSSSVINKPCWEWYTECQKEYSGQITKATKADEGKGMDEFLRNEIPDRVGTPKTPGTSSCLLPQEADDMSVDEGPWSERLVLSFGMKPGTSTQLRLVLTVLFEMAEELVLSPVC
jgi:tetratricopeptide (TPR) repeat protein